MKWDGLRKTERDKEIRLFMRQHPGWSQQEVADKFGLSRSNISRILLAGKREEKKQ